MPPAILNDENVAEHEVVEDKAGNVLERSQQDGELYSKPTVGIIYPPPEVRNIVDRTASFVARNGPEFEDRIRGNEADNPKFNFLNPNDPYHAYYEHKLKEFREGDPSEPVPSVSQDKEIATPGSVAKQKVAQVLETIIPKDPPPTYEYMIDPPTISAIDLDIVRLTAQFVAKNGKGFLTNLMTREQRNYQFDFLRPQHSLFQYFTRLVEQYTKVLLPPADICKTLEKEVTDCWKILDRVKYRVEWQKYQEREVRKLEDVKEKERIAFAQIDWHDFVVVETVTFREDEASNLPPPVTKDQLGARLLAQERYDNAHTTVKENVQGQQHQREIAMDVVNEVEEDLYQPSFQEDDKKQDEEKAGSDMEEESDEDEPVPPPPPKEMPPPMAPPSGLSSSIRKNYDPKAKTSLNQAGDKFLISPLTGEKVPVESMAAHMKINLLDPRWKEQKEKAIEEKRQQEQVFADGVHIGDTLKQLAERRSDIFGVGAEETFIGRKLGEEEAPKKIGAEIWDGHTASMERTTKLAHSNITFEDQIKAIHRSKGLLPSEDAEKIGPSIPTPEPTVFTAPPKVQPPPPQLPMIMATPSSTVSSEDKPRAYMDTLSATNTAMISQPPVSPIMPPIQTNLGMAPPPLMPPRMMMPPPANILAHPQVSAPPTTYLQPPDEASLRDDGEPNSKRVKLDGLEADLLPEDIYLQQNRLPVTFRVQVPELPEKPEWQCQGQVLKVTLPLSDQCSMVKTKVSEMIGMPTGKQKLLLSSYYIKDSNTLAYYNFSSSTLINIQLKERGGRKK